MTAAEAEQRARLEPQYTQWAAPLARQCSVRAVSLNWHWQCEPDPYTEKSTGCQWHWLVGTCPKLALVVVVVVIVVPKLTLAHHHQQQLVVVVVVVAGAPQTQAPNPQVASALALMEQQALDVERIRQYPGRVQVERRVKLKVPGKHFPALTPAEQKESYDGTAVEFV